MILINTNVLHGINFIKSEEVPKAATNAIVSIGTNVVAEYVASDSAAYIYSTSGIGTINKASLRNFLESYSIEAIQFNKNQVYAPPDSSYLFANLGQIFIINFYGLNTSKVTNMSHMLSGTWARVSDYARWGNWDTSKVTDMSYMFENCHNLSRSDLAYLGNWNVSNVSNMEGMFYNCKKLSSNYYDILGLTSLTPLSNWNVSKVTNMSYMFYNCTELTTLEPIKNWAVSNVIDMSYMFNNCSGLTTLGTSNSWNVSKVTNMSRMFSGCSGLTTLEPIKNWAVSNVTDMSYMFNNCSGLTTLGTSNSWNVSKVTNMKYMFYNCTKITTLEPIKNWVVSNVTDMSYMFNNCSGLTTLGTSNSWNVSKVTNMSYMFYNCTKITTLEPIKNWNTSNVTNMSDMFRYCNGLITVDLSNWNTSKVTNMEYMFYYCKEITKLDLRNWNMAKVNNTENMFTGCSALEEIYTPAVLGSGTVIKLANYDYIDADIPNDETTYSSIDGSDPKFSKSVHLIRGTIIVFDLNIAEDYKLEEYESVLRGKVFPKRDMNNMSNTGGTEGMGEDILPVTSDGKAIVWDNTRLEKELNGKFIGWKCSVVTNKVFSVPYVSSDFRSYEKVVYTPIFKTNKIGDNVVAEFEEATETIRVYSTSGIGTINRDFWKNYIDSLLCDVETIKTIIFTNEVYAPQDSSGLFEDLKNLTSINIEYLNMSNVTNVDNIFRNSKSIEEIYTPKMLPAEKTINLPREFRIVFDTNDGRTYSSLSNSNPIFSKSVQLISKDKIGIVFDLGLAEDYKLEEYDSILQTKIFSKDEIKNMNSTGGTEGKGEDILPVTQDGKCIFWDNERLESETGCKFVGWESSYDNNIFQVPFVSSYFSTDTRYTAVFAKEGTEYDLELTSIGEQTGRLLKGAQYKIEGAGRRGFEEKYYTVDETGKILIEKLQKDEEYIFTELRTAPGYKVRETPIKFKATAENGIWKLEVISGGFSGRPVFSGATLKAELEDEIAFKVEKTDSETGEHLQGAKFTVKDETGNYAKDVDGKEVGIRENINGEEIPVITTNLNGFATAEVNLGIYEVTEVQAPVGYDLSENRTQSIEIKSIQEEKLGVDEVWSSKYTSNSSDIIERVVLTKDGGRIFVGSIGDVEEDGVVVKGGSNLVVKYNKKGNRVWGVDFRYGYPNMVVETKDEGLLVLGNSGMVKYRKQEQGYEEEWDSKIFTSTSSKVTFRYITETSDGGFTLAGTKTVGVTLKDAETSITLPLKGSTDIFIIKYKKSGDTYIAEWTENMATSGGPFVTAIMETQDKGILIGGAVTGSITLPNGSKLTNTKTVDNTFLIKYNQNTNGVGYTYNWGKRLTGDQNRITGITETTNGEYVVGGYLNGTVNLPNGTNLIGKGSLDNMVVKFDSSGNVNLSFSIGGSGAELVNQVSATNDGGFVTAGSMTSNVTLENGQAITPKGNRDALVVRYDKDGHVVWANTYGGSKMDYFTSVHVDSDNNILLGTYFASESLTLYNGDVLLGTDGNVDAAMIHLKEYVVQPEIIESDIALFEDTKHVYNITTAVEGEGGSISGQDETPYEQVKYNETSLKDIIVTPNKGYEASSITINGVEISFVENDDGTVVLDKFTNVSEDKNVVAKFEVKPFNVIRNEISKTGTELITREGEKVSYDIQYSGEIEGYNGEATVTIVDYLPYEIDENTSLLDGGTYDENAKTITWVENILESDAGYEGNKIVGVSKHISVNYKNVDYTQPMFTNRVTSNLVIGDKEYTASGTHDTRISFTKTVEVTKKWDNTNNIYEIPNAVKIQLKNGDVVVAEKDLTSINRVTDVEIPENEDIWKCEFTDLPIYDEAGNEIVYTVNEVEINEGDLRYYQSIYDQENMIITNTYIGPVISQTKETVTESGNEYAVEGEKITYKITAKNEGEVAKDIVIKDSVPSGTTFVDGSIKVNGVTTLNTTGELANGISVTVAGKGEVTLSFDVIVNGLDEGTYFKQIKNVATVDGENTNETIINVNKSNIVFEKTVTPEGNVTVGQELTYNIKVQNTGSLADIVKIMDSIPENTTYVANSVKLGDKSYTDEELLGGKTSDTEVTEGGELTRENTTEEEVNLGEALTEENTLEGERNLDEELTKENTSENEVYTSEEQNVEKESVKITKIGEVISKILVENLKVSPDEEITLSFKVIVNENVDNGTKISNIAVINDNPSNITENTVVKPVINVTKEIKDVVHTSGEKNRLDYVFKGDTITYNIKATNNGDLGGYVTVKDIISDMVTLEAESIMINGSSSYETSTDEIIDLKGKTAADLANGIDIYVPERQNEKAGETIISFNVKVKEDAVTGDVLNKATWIEKDKTEEHETKIVKVPVVIFEKTSKVIRKTTETQELLEGKVTANDEIEYTITVRNTGTADSGSFTITDTVPENTNLIDEINFHDEYLTNGELQGNKLTWLINELEAGQSVDVKFSVVVKYNKAETLEIKNTAYVNEIPTNEIVTEYEKPTPKLTTEVSKSGDETAIVGNGISYTIAYTGEIKDFIGKANIVIVDQLPYEIDEVKSKLDNGIYDKETKTITWEIPAEDIDTYAHKRDTKLEITKKLLLYYNTQLIEQDIENKVTARTEIIELLEEKVVDTDEVSSSHIVKIRKLSELPLTGGIGTIVFTTVGVAFIVIGAALLITINKKKNAKN